MAARQLESSQHEYNRVHEELSKQANLAFESLKLAYSSYHTALRNLDISQETYRLAQIKHREGVLSANHLLDIEADLSRAESMLYSTEADYHLVLNQYSYTTGYNPANEGTNDE